MIEDSGLKTQVSSLKSQVQIQVDHFQTRDLRLETSRLLNRRITSRTDAQLLALVQMDVFAA